MDLPLDSYLLPNGDIVFKKRGKPPTSLPGYTRDKGDIYLFHLDTIDCSHREALTRQMPCGKYRVVLNCRLLNKTVNQMFCNDCELGE